jgi:hypothetical protein
MKNAVSAVSDVFVIETENDQTVDAQYTRKAKRNQKSRHPKYNGCKYFK